MWIEVVGQRLRLLPEKALYVEASGLLLVADLHLGKSETFQAHGIPVGTAVNQATIARLSQLCATWQPTELVILGDLFHSRWSLAPTVLQPWQDFLAAIACSVTFIAGNHDRALLAQLPPHARLQVRDTYQMDNLWLSHAPHPQTDRLNLCGHVHPCVQLRDRRDRLRLPCFYLDAQQNSLVLPAFGDFTGGYEVDVKNGAIAYAIAEQTIVPLTATRPTRRPYR